MRFILKTSPLLSKCVDKNFIRSALKNIQYEDINKLELKIAENIISRFDQIRKAVKESRKFYKQSRNNEIKERIV
jgi:pyrroloquinoline quinone (PQQ) biosynthesis protein C